MKQPNSLIKLAAVASSVLLLSGLVGYRAGAFHWLRTSREIVSEEIPEPGPTMMYGSKAGIFVDAPSVDTTDSEVSTMLQGPSASGGQTVIMPGSKSAIVVPATSAPAPKQTDSQPASASQSRPPSQ